ncbi:hypothetical protein BGX29_011789 [Mortierella sp. GBA35]|nr:hypothetical protein BGX29_011789 [Mortierella sp. GBA35]
MLSNANTSASAADDPCTVLGGKSASKITYNDVASCYQSIPFDRAQADSTLKTLRTLFNDYYVFRDASLVSTQELPFQKESVDVLKALGQLDTESYSNDYQFHMDVRTAIGSLRDGHASYEVDCYSAYSFTLEPFLLYAPVTKNEETKQFEQFLRVYKDPVERENGNYNDCIVETIDGQDGLNYTKEWASKSVFISHDIGVQLNAALASHKYNASSKLFVDFPGEFSFRILLPEKAHVDFQLKCPKSSRLVSIRGEWRVQPRIKAKFEDGPSFVKNVCLAEPRSPPLLPEPVPPVTPSTTSSPTPQPQTTTSEGPVTTSSEAPLKISTERPLTSSTRRPLTTSIHKPLHTPPPRRPDFVHFPKPRNGPHPKPDRRPFPKPHKAPQPKPDKLPFPKPHKAPFSKPHKAPYPKQRTAPGNKPHKASLPRPHTAPGNKPQGGPSRTHAEASSRLYPRLRPNKPDSLPFRKRQDPIDKTPAPSLPQQYPGAVLVDVGSATAFYQFVAKPKYAIMVVHTFDAPASELETIVKALKSLHNRGVTNLLVDIQNSEGEDIGFATQLVQLVTPSITSSDTTLLADARTSDSIKQLSQAAFEFETGGLFDARTFVNLKDGDRRYKSNAFYQSSNVQSRFGRSTNYTQQTTVFVKPVPANLTAAVVNFRWTKNSADVRIISNGLCRSACGVAAYLWLTQSSNKMYGYGGFLFRHVSGFTAAGALGTTLDEIQQTYANLGVQSPMEDLPYKNNVRVSWLELYSKDGKAVFEYDAEIHRTPIHGYIKPDVARTREEIWRRTACEAWRSPDDCW